MIAGLGWPAVFWLTAALGCLCLWLGRESGQSAKRVAVAVSFDLCGAIFFGIAIAGLALTMALPFGAISMGLLLASGISGLMFLRVERTASAPFFPKGTMADGGLRRGLAANALVAAVMMTTLVVGPFYLARSVGLGSGAVGLLLTVGPVLLVRPGRDV